MAAPRRKITHLAGGGAAMAPIMHRVAVICIVSGV
jgi:hypothetical protein